MNNSYKGTSTANRNNTNGNRGYNNQNSKGYTPKPRYRLPNGYLSKGYYDESSGKKVMRIELVVEQPREIADGFKSDGLSYGQLRNFYEIVCKIKDCRTKEIYNDAEAIVALGEMISKAQNAVNKKNIPQSFLDFIEMNVKTVKNKEDLKVFHTHFMAVVGFSSSGRQ